MRKDTGKKKLPRNIGSRKKFSPGVNEFAQELSKYQQLTDDELVKLVKAGEIEPLMNWYDDIK